MELQERAVSAAEVGPDEGFCLCHGAPRRWQRDLKYRMGGRWGCRARLVKDPAKKQLHIICEHSYKDRSCPERAEAGMVFSHGCWNSSGSAERQREYMREYDHTHEKVRVRVGPVQIYIGTYLREEFNV